MGWRIVEIDKNCYVKLFLNNLIISGDINISIPINDIDVLLFANSRTNISVELLNELVNQNICVFFCDRKYMPCSMLFPIIGNVLTLKIFGEQIKWTNRFKSDVWEKIIKLKCNNQLKYLEFLGKINDQEKEWLNENIDVIKGFDETNREGQISRLYWEKLFRDKYSRQDDSLLINKILNYGYTVLNGMVARSVVKKGLDCRISIFHKSVHNQFALSSDLIEPFRNVVDILVVELLKRNLIGLYNGVLSKELKLICLDWIANFRVMVNGNFQQLNNAIDDFVDSLINKTIFNFEIEYSYDVDDKKKDYFLDEKDNEIENSGE